MRRRSLAVGALGALVPMPALAGSPTSAHLTQDQALWVGEARATMFMLSTHFGILSAAIKQPGRGTRAWGDNMRSYLSFGATLSSSVNSFAIPKRFATAHTHLQTMARDTTNLSDSIGEWLDGGATASIPDSVMTYTERITNALEAFKAELGREGIDLVKYGFTPPRMRPLV